MTEQEWSISKAPLEDLRDTLVKYYRQDLELNKRLLVEIDKTRSRTQKNIEYFEMALEKLEE